MSRVTDALKEIEKAVKEGDSGVIGQYLADSSAKVRSAAEDALSVLSQNDVEDKTPPLEVPKDAKNLSEEAEKVEEEREAYIDGRLLTKKDPDANFPIRPADWIEMTEKEMKKYEKDGLLVGYSPKLGLGLLKKGVKA